MTISTQKICVLGGGFGGLYTALYLSQSSLMKAGKLEITLVERHDHFVFTPLLYELITGELQRWEIVPSYQRLLAGSKIHFCQQTIKDVNFTAKEVILANQKALTYDYLVFAVGNQNRWLDIPGLKTHALTFRTLADVEQLQGKLHLLETTERQHLKVAVIGGGPNGVELACKLADRLGKRGQVRIIERGDALLKGFSAGVRKASYRALSSRQIQIEFQTEVKSLESDRILAERNEIPQTFPADLVIWTAGIEARNWVEQLNCPQTEQHQLLTHPTLQLIEYPDVFALGDMAQIHPTRQRIPATAQAAYQMARCAADNIMATIEGKRLKSFHYFHLGDMMTLGNQEAIVSCGFLNLEGRIAATIRHFAYIFRLPTLRHRLRVLKSVLQRIGLQARRFLRWRLIKGLKRMKLVKTK